MTEDVCYDGSTHFLDFLAPFDFFDFLVKMRTLSITTALALAASLLGQWLAERTTTPMPIMGDFITLRLSHNPGIAFSIHLPPSIQSTLIAIALIVICIVAIRSAKDRLSELAFGLIVGGAIANLIDRLPDGLVTDYIAVGLFPVFNLADACICVGVGLLIAEAFLKHRPA